MKTSSLIDHKYAQTQQNIKNNKVWNQLKRNNKATVPGKKESLKPKRDRCSIDKNPAKKGLAQKTIKPKIYP